MTRSEAGKLGFLKSQKTAQQLKQKRIDDYNNNPKLCKCCNKPIKYNSRYNEFCTRSCAATFNNRGRIKNTKITPDGKTIIKKPHCPNCGLEMKGKQYSYCSVKCQQDYQYKEKIRIMEESGNAIICNGKTYSLSKIVKKYFVEKFGNVCSICGIENWNNKPLVKILDHIDGDASNNKLNNLRLICSNCDSQLDTYKSKNKNGKRKYRKKYTS